MTLNKPSYSEMMRELGIEIISPEKTPICNSNSVNFQKDKKTGKVNRFKIKNLRGLRFRENEGIFLSFQDSEFMIAFFKQTQKRGCFTKETGVTTNKY